MFEIDCIFIRQNRAALGPDPRAIFGCALAANGPRVEPEDSAAREVNLANYFCAGREGVSR